MFKFYIFGTLLFTTLVTHAGLQQLNSTEMNAITGQGGADLSWTLSLNHKYATDMSKDNIFDDQGVYYYLDSSTCGTGKVLCRLAISPNNHLDSDRNKKWLVFKGIQGTLQIDEFKLDGTTIIKNLGTSQEREQTALLISFKDEYPLKIRNLGFETLAVENATKNDEGETLEGYARVNTYSSYSSQKINNEGIIESIQNANLFDSGAEQGFMGLNIHGNLHMNGNIKIFSYNCDGSGRC